MTAQMSHNIFCSNIHKRKKEREESKVRQKKKSSCSVGAVTASATLWGVDITTVFMDIYKDLCSRRDHVLDVYLLCKGYHDFEQSRSLQ